MITAFLILGCIGWIYNSAQKKKEAAQAALHQPVYQPPPKPGIGTLLLKTGLGIAAHAITGQIHKHNHHHG